MDGPCEVFGGDQRVATPDGLFTYPDGAVVCGELAWVEGRPPTLANPSVLIEVLSESTVGYDRGERLARYKGIAAVRDVVLLGSDAAMVEHWRRTDAGWVLEVREGSDVVALACDAALPLAEVYHRVWELPN